MKTLWTSHLQDNEDKERFERAVRSARPVFERLSEILDGRAKFHDTVDVSVDKYKQPGWDAIQAHYNGEKAMVKYIKELINLDQKDTQ